MSSLCAPLTANYPPFLAVAPYPVGDMNQPHTIRLPADLIPADGRFGSGPAVVMADDLNALAATGATYLGTSHRREPVRSVVGAIRSGLSDLYQLPDGYEVLLGVGGATAFWDAAAFGLIERTSQHLVFGEFSAKFAAVASGAPWLDEPEIVASEPGSHPWAIPAPEVDTFALTHNETSTGVMMPIDRPGGDGSLVLVDATSAAGAIVVDPLQFDAYYFSPQKALGSEGGLWLALCSPAALARIDQIAKQDRWVPPFLDLGIATLNSRKNQTYNTPALATLFLLRRNVDRVLGLGGLEWAQECSASNANWVYEWAEHSSFAEPFVSLPRDRSLTTATIDLSEAVSAEAVISALAGNGVLDVGGYRKLGRNQLRIGTFPNVALADLARLTEAIDYIVEHL
jgi:phosphoserine aminotransferase